MNQLMILQVNNEYLINEDVQNLFDIVVMILFVQSIPHYFMRITHLVCYLSHHMAWKILIKL